MHNHLLAKLLNKVVTTTATVGDMESDPDPSLDFDMDDEMLVQSIGVNFPFMLHLFIIFISTTATKNKLPHHTRKALSEFYV